MKTFGVFLHMNDMLCSIKRSLSPSGTRPPAIIRPCAFMCCRGMVEGRGWWFFFFGGYFQNALVVFFLLVYAPLFPGFSSWTSFTNTCVPLLLHSSRLYRHPEEHGFFFESGTFQDLLWWRHTKSTLGFLSCCSATTPTLDSPANNKNEQNIELKSHILPLSSILWLFGGSFLLCSAIVSSAFLIWAILHESNIQGPNGTWQRKSVNTREEGVKSHGV